MSRRTVMNTMVSAAAVTAASPAVINQTPIDGELILMADEVFASTN
jgi:hypothetical protein